MSHQTTDASIQQIKRRLGKLEKKPLLALDSLSGLGLIVTIGSLLFLLWQRVSGLEYSLVALLFLVIGMVIVVHSSGFIGMSRSTRALIQQSVTGRLISSGEVHKSKMVIAKKSRGNSLSTTMIMIYGGFIVVPWLVVWVIVTKISQPELQYTFLLAIPSLMLLYALIVRAKSLIIVGIIAVFGVLSFSLSPFISISYLIVFSLLMTLWAYHNKEWRVQALVTAGTFLTLISIATSFPNNTGIQVAVLLTSLVCALAFSLPFVFHRREIKDRRSVRAILLMVSAYCAILPLLLSSYLSYQSWGLALILLTFMLSGFSAVSLARHGRFSYAKYYGLALVVLLMLSSTILGTATIATVSWLLISMILLIIGFMADSYTARTAGFGTLLLSLLYYLTAVFPSNSLIVGPVIVEERVWIGGLFILFMFVLGLWYKEYPVESREKEQKSLIIDILYVVAFGIAGLLMWVTLTPPLQTLAYIVTGFTAIFWGLRQKSVFIQAGGVSLVLVSLAKIVFYDTVSLPDGHQIILLCSMSVLVIGGGYLIKRLNTK